MITLPFLSVATLKISNMSLNVRCPLNTSFVDRPFTKTEFIGFHSSSND